MGAAVRKPALAAVGAVSAALAATALALAGCSPPAPPRVQSAAGSSATLGKLVQVRAFGANPTKLDMWVYAPRSVRPRPAILLALHECGESGPDFYNSNGFSTLADMYGYIMIYPSSNWPDNCWDASSRAALRRGGGSDPVGLASMITYTERTYHADSRRVYITGASSGAMMTAVMLGDYPDVFAAGAIFMGVPFGCLAGPTRTTSHRLPGGLVTMSPQQWGDLVRRADPGYHGPRPRVQVWHGTADGTVDYANFGQEIKQWTNVLGASQAPLATDHPQPGWTRTLYGTRKDDIQVEAYSIRGAGHDMPEIGMEQVTIHFFGLDHH